MLRMTGLRAWDRAAAPAGASRTAPCRYRARIWQSATDGRRETSGRPNRTPVRYTPAWTTCGEPPTRGGRPCPGSWTIGRRTWTTDPTRWRARKTTSSGRHGNATTTCCGFGLDDPSPEAYCTRVARVIGTPSRTGRQAPNRPRNRPPQRPWTDGPSEVETKPRSYEATVEGALAGPGRRARGETEERQTQWPEARAPAPFP